MSHQLDCLILGGGIAGLWTLHALLAEGYDAALVETSALGTGQTIASQGIIHAGTKYALTGHAAEAAKAANKAAAIWIDCLQSSATRGGAFQAPSLLTSSTPPSANRDPALPDLSTTKILSPHNYLFTTPGPASRLTALAASKALATKPNKLARDNLPPAFTGAPAGVDVYQLDEPVLDIPSLLDTLAAPCRNRLIHASKVDLSWSDQSPPRKQGSSQIQQNPERTRRVVAHLTTDSGTLTLHPRALLCTAGIGNEALLAQLDLVTSIPMQRRPLHMTVARLPVARLSEPGGVSTTLPTLNAHCVSLSDKPRMTFTTVNATTGPVWLIGGNISETGIDRTPEQQIAETRKEIAKILPWLDLAALEFATFRVDRAEGANPDAKRPDTAVVVRHESVIACWPTKLVLAPLAAAEILAHLNALDIAPALTSNPTDADSDLPVADLPFTISPPGLATPPWDREDTPWT